MDEQVTSTPTMADYYGMIKAEHEANNAWSAEQAQKAMDYQTQMSNTAHQREVADLKAAGLNPILSAGGQGATTGTGQMAQRSDSNIDALYGLTKMAIENSMVQANAMANTAKYSSGHAGSALAKDSSKSSGKTKSKNSSSDSEDEDLLSKKEKDAIVKASANALLNGKGNSTDFTNLLNAVVTVVGARKEYADDVAKAPHSYIDAVLGHGLERVGAKPNYNYAKDNKKSGAIVKALLSPRSNSAKKALRKLS